jgi:hypothetical protein
MKPDHDDRLEAGGVLDSPREFSVERLQRPEIVGEVRNPLLETARRLWWRAFDRVCGFFVLTRLSILDRISGPEPPTPADLTRGPIESASSGLFQWPLNRSNPENTTPGKIERRDRISLSLTPIR